MDEAVQVSVTDPEAPDVLTAVRFVGTDGTAAEATFVSANEKSAERPRRATIRLVLNLMVSPR